MELLKKYLSAFIIITLASNVKVNAQINPLQIQKIDSSMVAEAKPILILMSTDWCEICKVQKKLVRKNVAFKNKIDSFYYIEFDAESTDSIVFKGNSYKSNRKRSRKATHDLAFKLNGSENIAFPTWVLLNHKYQVVFRHGSLLYPEQVEKVLKGIEQLNE